MKCPLLTMYAVTFGAANTYQDRDCLKEECAWWQKELQNCIIYQLGMEIGTLCLFLEEISAKMPKDLAPRG